MIVVAITATLLRHGATDFRVVRFRFDMAADIGGVVAHDVHPGKFSRLTRDIGQSCKEPDDADGGPASIRPFVGQ
jgi:hypothetical protein